MLYTDGQVKRKRAALPPFADHINLPAQFGRQLPRNGKTQPGAPILAAGAAIRLLEFFGKQLSLMANQIALQEQAAEPPQVARARQFIHEHSGEEISLGDVARAAAISPFYLCKKFKETTGLHFTDYVSRVRVEKAKELLRNPNNRISEVAYQTGFQSLSHFNRCFKRIAGESPTNCREKMQSI